jgi:hypothetical protein
MLPGIADSWVADATGERYTAELRIAAVDPTRWQPERCFVSDALLGTPDENPDT